MLRVDSNDISVTQNDLCNQKLQTQEGRSHKLVLDKSLFDQRDEYFKYRMWQNLHCFALSIKEGEGWSYKIHFIVHTENLKVF